MRTNNASYWYALACIGFFVSLGLFLFYPYIFSTQILFTNDGVINAHRFDDIPFVDELVGIWRDDLFVGMARYAYLNIPMILRAFVGAELSNDAVWPIAYVAGSLALIWYLRLKDVGWIAAIVAAMVGFWLGSNFTLVYSGHDKKPFVLLFFVLALCLSCRLAATLKLRDAILLGGSVGAMFMHQADVAFLFCLFLIPYVIFELFIANGHKVRLIAMCAASAAVATLLSIGPLLGGYAQYGKDVAIAEDPQKKWEFVTQWSWPPNESIEFIAPGYMGWRSDDPAGPYWGEMGRSANWPETKQGYPNFKLESTYLGIVPFVLVLLTMYALRHSPNRSHIIFWAGVAIATLFLSFGKYTFVYRWFYELPVVHHVRNPNKFMQLFQLSIAIMSAYGMTSLMTAIKETQKRDLLIVGSIGFLAVAMLAFAHNVNLSATRDADLNQLVSSGFSEISAEKIYTLKQSSLMHLSVIAGAAGLFFAICCFPSIFRFLSRYPSALSLVIILVVLIDGVKHAGHYLQTMPKTYIAANPLSEILKEQIEDQRFLILDRGGVNNVWASFLVPYHDIAYSGVVLISRLPNDYDRFYRSIADEPLRQWRLTATAYLLATRRQADRLIPEFASPVLEYDVISDRNSDIRMLPIKNGQDVLLKLRQPAPRFALIAGSLRLPESKTLELLRDDDYPLFERVLLELDSEGGDLDGRGIIGEVRTLASSAREIRLAVDTNQPAYLRIANRFDKHWVPYIDGTEANLLRADYLFQAVYVPSGSHNVTLKFSPPIHFLALQTLGLVIVIASLLSTMLPRRQSHRDSS